MAENQDDKQAAALLLLAVRKGFEWDADALRYRRLSTGRFVSQRAVRLAIRRSIKISGEEMKALSEQVASGEITVGEWQARMSFEVKNLHVSSAMAARGGPANMTPADYLRAGRELKFNYGRLEIFAREIEDRKLTRKQIKNRTAMFIASAWGTYEGGRRDGAVAAGFDEERNVLGDRIKHCHDTTQRQGCVELTRLGWIRIGTMPQPGRRACLTGCGCFMKFRKRRRFV